MLGHAKFLLEDGKIAINSKFTKLITALRTAVGIDGVLDKKTTSYDDILDAYRLSAKCDIQRRRRTTIS